MPAIPTLDGATRGQTSLDFVVGIAIFLLVLTLALSFVPEMFAPFENGQERPLVSDRVADRIAGPLLGEPTEPSVLNETCTFAFFGAGTPAGCGFLADETLTERIGLDDAYRVNVSIRRNRTTQPGLETICTDGNGLETGSCTTELTIGPTVPTETGSVAATHRTATLDGRDVRILVRVW